MGKSIILCFDGTSENFGPEPFTNVLKIYRLLDTTNQLCYYQPGIGTSRDFDEVDTWGRYLSISRLKNLLDSMFAFCLDDHIISAYKFLMTHYEVNDQIYMFGFSRGAFIARVLTGMLERVGLLNKGLEDMVPMAWKIYECWEFAEQPIQPNYQTTLIEEFTKTFCRALNIKIHFQGLFDSVNSVGLLRDRLFPCTQRSNIVRHVRHALSTDERRGKFKQFCFTPNPYEPTLFSLQYKPYEKEIIKTSIVTSSHTDMLDGHRSVSDPTILKNPLIEYTLKKSRTGSDDNSSENSPSYYDAKVNLGNESLQELERTLLSPPSDDNNLTLNINQFLQQHELFSGNSRWNVEPSGKYIEGSFHLERNYPDDISPQYSSMNLWTKGNNTSHSTVSPDLIEKWFPGDHSDIGGGTHKTYQGSISDLSLSWVLAESIRHGVKFKPSSINRFAQRHSSSKSLSSTIHDFLNATKSELIMEGNNKSYQQEDLLRIEYDCSSNGAPTDFDSNNIPTDLNTTTTTIDDEEWKEKYTTSNDKISIWSSMFWWLLEFLPIGIRIEDKDGKWRNRYVPNMGRSRCIPEYGDVHWSVFWIIKHNSHYRPRNLPRYVRDVVQEKLNIQLPSVKTNSTLTLDEKEKKRELKRMLDKWIENNWQEIPDDLHSLLKNDPTL